MLQTSVERDLLADRVDGEYLFPDYGDYCFASVNPALLSLLGAETDRQLPDRAFADVDTDVDRVVLVFLDGYGWEHWKRDHESVPLLDRFTRAGTVTPLTAIYPSETAAATTTFHTGRTPVEHGLLGWWQHVDDVDAVVQALAFATLDGDPADEEYPALTYDQLYAGESIYERASADGVESALYQPFTAPGPEQGATIQETYENVADLAVQLRDGVENASGPDYLYGYVSNVDTASHRYGTDSERYRAQLEMVAASLRREFERVDPVTAERTLVALTADHGIVDTVPGENVDVREDPDIWEHLREDADGDPIPPVGSPRNLHLFLEEGSVETVRETVESRYPCRTFTRAKAIDRGLFGDAEPSPLFRRRCGDLIVVHRNRGMWWEERELDLVGMHGGLTREEMLVPFAVATLADLQA